MLTRLPYLDAGAIMDRASRTVHHRRGTWRPSKEMDTMLHIGIREDGNAPRVMTMHLSVFHGGSRDQRRPSCPKLLLKPQE